mgnify:FL=1
MPKFPHNVMMKAQKHQNRRILPMNEILLLEDEESVSRGIAFTLEKAGYCVYACDSIAGAEQVFRERMPELLICDLNLPDGSGLDFIKRIRESGKGIYILCLTALDSETDFVVGYGAGADDYVAKPFSLSVLLLKVQTYFERNQKTGKVMLCSGNIRVNRNEMRVWKGEMEISLTMTEWKLLLLFLEHPKQILSKNQILEQLFDTEGDFVEENTVAVNIRRLREKVEDFPAKPEYIKNIRGMGYLWTRECSRF